MKNLLIALFLYIFSPISILLFGAPGNPPCFTQDKKYNINTNVIHLDKAKALLDTEISEKASWVCPRCGHSNLRYYKTCTRCGLKRPGS